MSLFNTTAIKSANFVIALKAAIAERQAAINKWAIDLSTDAARGLSWAEQTYKNAAEISILKWELLGIMQEAAKKEAAGEETQPVTFESLKTYFTTQLLCAARSASNRSTNQFSNLMHDYKIEFMAKCVDGSWSDLYNIVETALEMDPVYVEARRVEWEAADAKRKAEQAEKDAHNNAVQDARKKQKRLIKAGKPVPADIEAIAALNLK